MIIPAEKAQTFYCPMQSDVNGLRGCYGAECAAWRWSGPIYQKCIVAENVNAQTEEEAKGASGGQVTPSGWEFSPADASEPACWVEPREEASKRRHGYCGMAGAVAPGCG